jgi:hypothetical protein
MSDYDVFPLHDFRNDGRVLPNNGNLTLHNRLCPSLVSGSGDEWLRVANTLIDYAAKHEINSDQKALVEIAHESPDTFQQDWSVTQTVFSASSWNVTECGEHTPESMRAVHFAHTPVKRALKEGKLPKGWTLRNRAEVANKFMEQWLRQCGARKSFVRDERLLLASRGTFRPQIPVDKAVAIDNSQRIDDSTKMPFVTAPTNDTAHEDVVDNKLVGMKTLAKEQKTNSEAKPKTIDA